VSDPPKENAVKICCKTQQKTNVRVYIYVQIHTCKYVYLYIHTRTSEPPQEKRRIDILKDPEKHRLCCIYIHKYL